MKKQALLYSPFAGSNPHFETDLELAECYLSEGYEVTLLACSGSLKTCELNPNHKSSICFRCRSRHKSGVKWLGEERIIVEDFYWIRPSQKDVIQKIYNTEISSIKQFRSIEVEDVDIGEAAFSSVVSLTRDIAPDIQIHQRLLRANLITAAEVYFSIKNHLERKQPDVFILYNGRYAPLRPALRAAQRKKVETYVHEVSGVIDRYRLTHNTYPHDIDTFKTEIEDTYRNSKLSEKVKKEIAYLWFQERQNNESQGFQVFTKHQSKDRLPESFDKKKVNVAIFNSSEDEMIAIEGWENPFYSNQNEGIRLLCEAFKQDERINFFLRIHPHLEGVENKQTRLLEKLDSWFPNLEVIAPLSPVSSYRLVEACDITITFGSTVGIEAVYMGKPSVLMGRAIYEDLGSVIKPTSHEDLVEIISEYCKHRTLPSIESSDAGVVKYGFAQKKNGYLFKYANRHNLYKVSLSRNGEKKFIKASLLSRVMGRVGAL